MKQRNLALILAAALTLGLCVPALANGTGDSAAPPPDPVPQAQAEAPAESAPTLDAEPEEPAETPYIASHVRASSVDDDLVFTGDSDFRSLRFEDLRDRVLEGSLTALMLEESIASIDAMDYTKMYSDLASQLSSLELAQEMYAQIPVATPFEGVMQGYVISNLAGSYASLSSTVSDLATGKLQKDAAAAKRQLGNARDLTVMGAETLYITILELEQTRETLRRNLTALDRTQEEMELRFRLGQISALTLEQVKNGKASLESSLSTLEMNVRRCKLQLQAMIGVSLNGSLVLGALPELSGALIDSMNYDHDLAEAKEQSYDLFAARKKLDEASDTYDDTYSANTRDSYSVRSARHTYESAKYEYQMSLQSFEMNFRNAFSAVGDYRQILTAAETSLVFQERTYASMELKYEQGTISHNALLDAADSLSEAKEAVATAKRNLFSAYRTYYWVVNYGVMSSGA